MRSPAKTMFIGLDACDLHLTRKFAADGSMPVLGRLLQEAAVVETIGPVGYFVSANWPTIWSGTTPSRHHFICAGRVVGGTYNPEWFPGSVTHPPAVWDHLSNRGLRVASLDAPHATAASELNGIQLVEWGCHDRHTPRTTAYPNSFVDEANETFGSHLMGAWVHADRPHFSPCDLAHRAGDHRTFEEDAALYADMLVSQRRKHNLSLDVLDRGDWDLFFTVLGETHCTGHQFWKVYDDTHPWFDPARRAFLGPDPVRTIYKAIDSTVGAHLERADADTTVYVLLNHGMGPHYDGLNILDPLLWRLDQYLSGASTRGWRSRVSDVAAASIPTAMRPRAYAAASALRRRYSDVVPIGVFDEAIPWLGRRRWWAQPNDTGPGSIRLNLEGREPNGRIRASTYRDALAWLAERLLEVVNVETGQPAFTGALLVDDYHERFPGDCYGDLLLEWNRTTPTDVVWSPATGVVRVPYNGNRTGDHHPRGLLLATGPGIRPGLRSETVMTLDVAPTLAASLGQELPDVDGLPLADFVPEARRPAPVKRPPLTQAPPPRAPARRRLPSNATVPLDEWVAGFAMGLSGGLHHTATTFAETRARVDELTARTDQLDQLALITQVTAWLRQVDVPETLLVSVVTPTRNRRDLLTRAIASVQAQTYGRWELLVVDDASTDGTAEFVEAQARADERIRAIVMDTEHRDRNGSSRARNAGLDAAKGDVVVYLDDDNRFDADWLRSVVWMFTEYPDVEVCYGARVIDDDERHRSLPTRSLPIIQFNSWDREAQLEANRVDQNVIAHRPSVVRFDETLNDFMDWDHLLQLTDTVDANPLPVLAAYYYSDQADRMTNRFLNEPEVYRYVREKTMRRRANL